MDFDKAGNKKMVSNQILVIEDEIEFAQMMKIRLELSGYDVGVATDTQSGLDAVLRGEYDLLILDLMMPGGGGFALLEQIKSRGEIGQLPVIVVTGKTMTPEVKAMIGAYHIAATFTKPYDPVEFIEKVKALMSASGSAGIH